MGLTSHADILTVVWKIWQMSKLVPYAFGTTLKLIYTLLLYIYEAIAAGDGYQNGGLF